MKKGLSILIALAMVALLVPVAISADGTTRTVGPSETYTTIKDALTASSAGDTIQLVADINEGVGDITKAVTIDTNGYQWTSGGYTASDGKPKVDACHIKSTVTITNSKRTGQVTADTPFDIISAHSQTNGGAIRVDSGGHLTLQNIAIDSENKYTKNVL